ncbi:hypothetical protein SBA3_4010005 [Candidatus Sulfopaludibacter sp. SbA3]|nr:hypothetical protein SBA3_4010005 [Candidatus Sulfopaludibacter sp. SbA3]
MKNGAGGRGFVARSRHFRERRLMRRSLTRPDENSLAPWDRRSFFVVCRLRVIRHFSRESAQAG